MAAAKMPSGVFCLATTPITGASAAATRKPQRSDSLLGASFMM